MSGFFKMDYIACCDIVDARLIQNKSLKTSKYSINSFYNKRGNILNSLSFIFYDDNDDKN